MALAAAPAPKGDLASLTNANLNVAAYFGIIPLVEHRLDAGDDPDLVIQESGAFPLLFADQEGHIEAVRMLLDKGAEPGKEHSMSGDNAVAVAQIQGHTAIVNVLHQAGAY